ncbi:hypothetical protein ACVWZL_009186 [Bradyrhizobium sp. GM2.4]
MHREPQLSKPQRKVQERISDIGPFVLNGAKTFYDISQYVDLRRPVQGGQLRRAPASMRCRSGMRAKNRRIARSPVTVCAGPIEQRSASPCFRAIQPFYNVR